MAIGRNIITKERGITEIYGWNPESFRTMFRRALLPILRTYSAPATPVPRINQRSAPINASLSLNGILTSSLLRLGYDKKTKLRQKYDDSGSKSLIFEILFNLFKTRSNAFGRLPFWWFKRSARWVADVNGWKGRINIPQHRPYVHMNCNVGLNGWWQ